MLEDGTYDIIIVDATPTHDEPGALRLEVTVLGGARKGDVVSVRATGLGLSDLDALGMPGTLVVRDGEPTVVVEA